MAAFVLVAGLLLVTGLLLLVAGLEVLDGATEVFDFTVVGAEDVADFDTDGTTEESVAE